MPEPAYEKTEAASNNTEPKEHPSFTLAKSLSGPWRSAFPHTPEQARAWEPLTVRRALASRVLVVLRTRVECAWAVYCDAVPGVNHLHEELAVLDHGDKLPEDVARALFPLVPKEVPYAR